MPREDHTEIKGIKEASMSHNIKSTNLDESFSNLRLKPSNEEIKRIIPNTPSNEEKNTHRSNESNSPNQNAIKLYRNPNSLVAASLENENSDHCSIKWKRVDIPNCQEPTPVDESLTKPMEHLKLTWDSFVSNRSVAQSPQEISAFEEDIDREENCDILRKTLPIDIIIGDDEEIDQKPQRQVKARNIAWQVYNALDCNPKKALTPVEISIILKIKNMSSIHKALYWLLNMEMICREFREYSGNKRKDSFKYWRLDCPISPKLKSVDINELILEILPIDQRQALSVREIAIKSKAPLSTVKYSLNILKNSGSIVSIPPALPKSRPVKYYRVRP